MKLNKYQKGVHVFLMLLLLVPALPKADSASGTLGKTLFATITEPKPAQTIDINVFDDEIFTIKGVAQRLTPVNLYIYSRVPQRIQNFTAAVSGNAVNFSWAPRPIFLLNPEQGGTGSPPATGFKYAEMTGNIYNAEVEVQTIDGTVIRRDTVNATITVVCNIDSTDPDYRTGTGRLKYTLEQASAALPGIFNSSMNKDVADDSLATLICPYVNSLGQFDPSFTLNDFSYNIWGGLVTGDLKVVGNQVESIDSRFHIGQSALEPLEAVSSTIDPATNTPCDLTIWSTGSGLAAFYGTRINESITIALGAVINSPDPACADLDGKRLMGSLPIIWSHRLINQSSITGAGNAVSCVNLADEMPSFACRDIPNTSYNRAPNHYSIHDKVVGYRDPFEAPGDPSLVDQQRINSNFMAGCNKNLQFVDSDYVEANGIPDCGGGEVQCDYSGCTASLCYTDLESCEPLTMIPPCTPPEAMAGPAQGCGTDPLGWYTTYVVSSSDHAEIDTPSAVFQLGDTTPDADQNPVAAFPTAYNGGSSSARNFRESGLYLFAFATKTHEMPCGSYGASPPNCGFDVVEDGAANSRSVYPIRDYLVLSDGFLQYEIYAQDADLVPANEGVTREKGTLLRVITDPSTGQASATISTDKDGNSLVGKKLRFAIFEVREGLPGGIGETRPVTLRIPPLLTDPYTSQSDQIDASKKGVIGHILTGSLESLYIPGSGTNAVSSPEKYEWEVFAEEGSYDEVGLEPLIADKDEHFEVIGTLEYDEDQTSGKRGLDKYVLNRFSNTHYIVATYRSSDTTFEGSNPSTLFMTAAREAVSFLSVKETGNISAIGVQNYKLYGVAYDTWTKNTLGNAQLHLVQTGTTRKYEAYATTGYEGTYTYNPPDGTYRMNITGLYGDTDNLIYPVSSLCGPGNVDDPYRDLYCGGVITVNPSTSLHFDIPVSPSIEGRLAVSPAEGNVQYDTFQVTVSDATTGKGGSAIVTPEGKFSLFLPVGSYTVVSVDKIASDNSILKSYTPGGSAPVNNTMAQSLNISI